MREESVACMTFATIFPQQLYIVYIYHALDFFETVEYYCDNNYLIIRYNEGCDMTFTQLRYAVEVAETGSINKAANNLFTSQSTVSTALHNLESELGRPIFIRNSHGVSMTPFGETFIAYVMPIVEQIKNLNKMVGISNSIPSVSLSLTSSGWTFLSAVLANLHDKYRSAGIRIEYYEGFGEEPIDLVANGMAEIGFVRRYTCYHAIDKKIYSAKKLQFFPIYLADIGVTVGHANPLFGYSSNYIAADMLSDSTALVHNYLDFGPYSDIFERLHLSPRNRIMVTTRASMYELIGKIDSYYLNSAFMNKGNNVQEEDVISPQRTLILKDCPFKSEFAPPKYFICY